MKMVLVLVFFGVACAQASVVANGGFELATLPPVGGEIDLVTGSSALTNWSVFSTAATTGTPLAVLEGPYYGLTQSQGSRWLDLTGLADSTSLFGGVSQSLSVVVGQTYLVTFDVGVCNGAACGGGVNLGAPVSVLARLGATSFTATNANSAVGNQWMSYQFLFTATSTTALLSFEGNSNTPLNHTYIGLDNIAVEIVAPEPASFALFGIGAAGLLAFARKRRR